MKKFVRRVLGDPQVKTLKRLKKRVASINALEEKYKKLEAKMKLLQAENELLKKLDMIERRVLKKK